MTSTASPIRWGILGSGAIARQFAYGLKFVPGTELLAIGSRSAAKAEEFAQMYQIPRAYNSYQSLVKDPDIDVVYVATPHLRHRDDCLLCLEAGKAVLCEKPLAMTARAAQEIIDQARQHKLFCMEAMWMRFIPLIQQVKERVDRGDIGKVLTLSAEFGYPTEFDPNNRFFNPNLGGGALLDRGSYPLSLAFYLLGQPVAVSGQAYLGTTGVDEQSAYLLSYAGGAMAQLSASLRAYTTNTATITGTMGRIIIHPPFCRPDHISLIPLSPEPVVTTRPRAGAAGFKASLGSRIKQLPGIKPIVNRLRDKTQTLWSAAIGNGLNYEAVEVNRCLREGLLESSTMPLEESLAILQVMDSLRKQWGLTYPQD
ncbi:MAG: Gfo/Idh/MocA family oxidoreductase [Nodosilinea sp. LVE1205-7]|jgi:predicted dehydrogenase